MQKEGLQADCKAAGLQEEGAYSISNSEEMCAGGNAIMKHKFWSAKV